MKADLDKIIRHDGNQKQVQDLFNKIFKIMQEEFTEDNLPGLTTYMLEKTLHAFDEYVLDTEYNYTLDLNWFGEMLKKEIDEYIIHLKSSIKEKDPLFKKAKDAVWKS